jgi:hypothetical protein
MIATSILELDFSDLEELREKWRYISRPRYEYLEEWRRIEWWVEEKVDV